MTHRLVGTAVFVTLALVSALFYKHSGGAYKVDKPGKIASRASFRVIYRYLQVSTLGLAIACLYSDEPWLLKVHDNLFAMYIGLAISVLSMAVFIAAKLDLGESYSPCFDSYLPRDLVREGIYRYVRHPIYSANLLLFFGIFVATGSIWMLLNTCVLYLYYNDAAVAEEKALESKFASLYRQYQLSTGRFIPVRRN